MKRKIHLRRTLLRLGLFALALYILIMFYESFINYMFGLALHNTDVRQVKLLIRAGADVRGRWKDYHPPGTTLFDLPNQIIHNDGVPFIDVAVHAASEQGHIDVLEFLLNQGADPNVAFRVPDREEPIYPIDFEPLFEENRPNWNVVQLLLQRGARPAVNDSDILVRATIDGKTDIVRELLETGANPNCNWDANPPLVIAADSLQTEIIDLLLQHRANPNACAQRQDTDGGPVHRVTALKAAMSHQATNPAQSRLIVRMLRLAGAQE